MAEVRTLKPVPEPDCCHNCSHRQWGTEEGWDKCEVTGKGMGWGILKTQVCDDHARFTGPGDDPRNVRSYRKHRAKRIRELEEELSQLRADEKEHP